MTGSAIINPAPGTQPSKNRDRSSSIVDSRTVVKVGSIVKGILKGATEELTEDEVLRRNTSSNGNNKRTVGYVASTISSENSNLSKGSVYGLTYIDSINTRTTVVST